MHVTLKADNTMHVSLGVEVLEGVDFKRL